MKKKLICVLGRTASGKDYFCKNVLKGKILVTYTTREKRVNETNGIEHWFISKDEMESIKNGDKGRMIAYTRIGEDEKIISYPQSTKVIPKVIHNRQLGLSNH